MNTIDRNLIFDIGVNEGLDTGFYLDKGFQVVGVEANPLMVAYLRQALGAWIVDGRYMLVDKGLWSERTSLTFYLNTFESHWSSFVKEAGTRNGTSYEELTIPCITIADLLAEYGVPYYMKIDIEAADRIVVKSLGEQTARPMFISVEEYGLAALDEIHSLGYQGFQIVQQEDKSEQSPPVPPREGRYVQRAFAGRDSGLFGLELPGRWMSVKTAKEYYAEHIRRDSIYIGPANEWYDIHAWLEPVGALL